MARAAIARRDSAGWRIGYCCISALCIWLITGQFWPTAILCAIMVGIMRLEAHVAGRYLAAGAEQRDAYRAAFLTATLASITSYTIIAAWAAFYGGAPGLLIAMLMTTASIINLTIIMVEAPHALALSVAPAALLFAILPLLTFVPLPAPQAEPGWAMLGLYLMIASYAMQAVRTARAHNSLFNNLTQAKVEAETRRGEAERGRVEAEQSRLEAVRANQLKTEFLCTVTHELRTPLNAVINYSEMISEESDGVIAQDANRITSSARHLLSLIERIMDFASLEAGGVHLKPALFDAEIEVRRIVEAHRAQIEANGNVIAIETIPARVFADRARFGNCLDCLLSNAAKYCTGAQILVTITERNGQVRISVHDTGPGMSAQAQERAFAAFHQDHGRAHGADGLGLGLAAARRTARLMDGDLTARSTPGQGSCFALSLPAAPPSAESAQAVA